MNGRFCRALMALSVSLVLALGPAAPAFAQQGQAAPPAQHEPAQPPPSQGQASERTIQESSLDFTSGKRWFPRIQDPYTPAMVPEPVLTNAPRIEAMVKDGKLSISLQDAVDLALQNNLAIVVERYVPWIAEASILHTLSGGLPFTGSALTALGTIPVPSFDPDRKSVV